MVAIPIQQLQVPTATPEVWEEPDVLPGPESSRVIRLDKPVAREPYGRTRLTKADRARRRRLTGLVATALLALVVGAAANTLLRDGESARPMRPLSAVGDGVYVVQPGDTLWSVAERLAPSGDPRPLVAELRSRHGGVDLQPGDRIEVGDLSG